MSRLRPLRSHPKLRGAATLTDHAWSEIAAALRITQRELQIIQGIFENLTEREIASRLAIAEHTVHTHLNRLFKKLTVTTRTELVLRVVEQLITLTLAETGVLPPHLPTPPRGQLRPQNPSAPSPRP